MSSSEQTDSGRDELCDCYRRMLLIRRFEETLEELFSKNLIGGTSHLCIGQEACAVGVVSETRPEDYLVSNHRGHGHLLARGLSPLRVMAELLGRKDGYCGGRGGSQHMCALTEHFLGTNGITGGGLPIAAGAAYALQYMGRDQVVVAFFGDGAGNQGTFHESLNMAGLWKLPVLFVCENNFYGMSMPVNRSTACASIAQRAAGYSMPGECCDGMDLLAVKRKTGELLAEIRKGNGPALLELSTYRYCGHSKNDARVYRTRTEEAEWSKRDCLNIAAEALRQRGIPAEKVEGLRTEVAKEMDEVVKTALSLPYGDAAHALGGVYA